MDAVPVHPPDRLRATFARAFSPLVLTLCPEGYRVTGNIGPPRSERDPGASVLLTVVAGAPARAAIYACLLPPGQPTGPRWGKLPTGHAASASSLLSSRQPIRR